MARRIEVPLPVTSAKDSPQRAGIGRLINVLMEQMPDGKVNRKRAPGITKFSQSTSGSIHCRGLIAANDSVLLSVFDNFVEAIDGSGNSTGLGGLSGTSLVSLAKNNKTPIPDIVCVADGAAYVLATSTAPAPYPDPNIGSPNSVCYGDGYFFFTYGAGECQASGLYSTSINLLDQITVNSSPTTLLRGVYFSQTLFLFTEATIEAWSNTANPTGFPFSRSAVIARGLLSATAIAGFESQFTATLIFVGNDNIVYLLQGYAPVRISTSDQERRISNLADKSTLRASVYSSEGHAIWQLTSSDFSLTYDITNSVWNERKSEAMNFSRIECGCFAFGQWIVGDYATGNLGRITANEFTEYGLSLKYSVDSLPCDMFPMRETVKRTDFNFIVGTGKSPKDDDYDVDQSFAGNWSSDWNDPNWNVGQTVQFNDVAANPHVLISWSDDGGTSFSMPLTRELGKVGQGYQCVSIYRSGMTSRYGRVWRVEVSDPVYVGLISAFMETA